MWGKMVPLMYFFQIQTDSSAEASHFLMFAMVDVGSVAELPARTNGSMGIFTNGAT